MIDLSYLLGRECCISFHSPLKLGTVVGFEQDDDDAIHLLVAMRPRDDGFSSLEWHAVGSVRIAGSAVTGSSRAAVTGSSRAADVSGGGDRGLDAGRGQVAE